VKIDVTSFDGQTAGSIELSDEVFGLEPRADLIFRMIRWQLAKRRAGTHAVKNRAEIARTGKKMYKQKGTGGARAAVPRRRPGFRPAGAQSRTRPHQEGQDAGA
jgi:large subunit ribosomal protein L4